MITNLYYRPEIDGLRAIAILGVILYHLFPNLLPGGFTGVDIFFVISGYLISRIIFNETKNNSFSFTNFYLKRCVRIIPTYTLVILLLALVGWFLFLSNQYINLGKHILYSSSFISNILLNNESGYFDVSIEQKPLMHLWSLSIEEQFYLLWPLIIIFLLRKRYILKILLLLGILSFILNIILSTKYPNANFYYLPTRTWEFIFGALISYFEINKKKIINLNSYFLNALYIFFGFMLIGYGFLFINNKSTYPGWIALYPVLGASIIITHLKTNNFCINLLSNNFLVHIGKISYPLYLYHWPIYFIVKEYNERNLILVDKFIIIISTYALSFLTYNYYELKIKNYFRKINNTKNIKINFIIFTMLLIALFLIGLLINKSYITSKSHYKTIDRLGAIASQDFPGQFTANKPYLCFLTMPHQNALDFDKGCFNWKKKKRVLIWGDSYATALYSGLNFHYSGTDVQISYLTTASCPPIIGKWNLLLPNCESINDFVIKQIIKDKIDIVIMGGNWISYSYFPQFKMQAYNTLKNLKDNDIKIIIVNQALLFDITFPEVLERAYIRKDINIPKYSSAGIDKKIFKINDDIINIFNNNGVTIISPLSLLCNFKQECLTSVGDNMYLDIITVDLGHFTKNGSIYLANNLIAPVLDNIIQDKSINKHTK